MTFTLNSSALTNRFNIRRTLRFWNDLIFLNEALIKRTGLITKQPRLAGIPVSRCIKVTLAESEPTLQSPFSPILTRDIEKEDPEKGVSWLENSATNY